MGVEVVELDCCTASVRAVDVRVYPFDCAFVLVDRRSRTYPHSASYIALLRLYMSTSQHLDLVISGLGVYIVSRSQWRTQEG